MRDRLIRFMSGRNGADQLSRASSISACVLALISIFGSNTVLHYLWYPALALFIYTYFRIFSRNLYKRQQENQHYLDKTEGIRRKLNISRNKFNQRQDYKFFSCPNCKTTVRVPKGKGTINITCPKCRERFTRKS